MVIDWTALAVGAGFTEYQGSTPLIAWTKGSEDEGDDENGSESDDYD